MQRLNAVQILRRGRSKYSCMLNSLRWEGEDCTKSQARLAPPLTTSKENEIWEQKHGRPNKEYSSKEEKSTPALGDVAAFRECSGRAKHLFSAQERRVTQGIQNSPTVTLTDVEEYRHWCGILTPMTALHVGCDTEYCGY